MTPVPFPASLPPDHGQAHLVRPSATHRASYLEALAEGYRIGNQPPKAVADVAADFDGHLRGLDTRSDSLFFAHGRQLSSVPSLTFWLVDHGYFIGSVNLRARIDTAILTDYGGHIGYGIRPSAQGRGYGKRQLALALEVARGIGISVVRISCATENVASRRVIEANGGLLLREMPPAWYTEKPFLLFEIPLTGAQP